MPKPEPGVTRVSPRDSIPTVVESVEVLQIGPDPTDVAVAVFVSHHYDILALEADDVERDAVERARQSFYDTSYEDVVMSTTYRSRRFAVAELGPDHWMSVAVFGPSPEKSVEVMRTLFPNTDGE